MSVIDNDPRVLAVGAPRSQCGGSFRLSQQSKVTHIEALQTGWTAELVTGSQQIVVRGPAAVDSYAEALDEAYATAQQALDVLTMRAIADFAIENADSANIVWWTATRALFTRVFCVSDMGMSVSSATATVTDADGNVLSFPEPPVVWHESLRYFRLAQVTSDLFDAYRNVYLGLEALLSDLVPQHLSAGKVNEGERAWLNRALQKVDSLLSLSSYAVAGSVDPVTDVLDDLYVGTRTALFHSKLGRPVLLPHSAIERTQVIDALERLSRLFLDLYSKHLGYVRPWGLVSNAAFELGTSYDAEAVVSDDRAPVSNADVVINPSGGLLSRLTTNPAPDLSKPGIKYWLGEQPATDLRSTLTTISRVGLQHAGALIQVDRLDDPLSLEGIDVLQVQQGVRLVNLRLPRYRFPT